MPQKKRTVRRKSSGKKRRTQKGRVYIPFNSIISLCAIVVGVCTALLLASTVQSTKPEKLPPQKESVNNIERKTPATSVSIPEKKPEASKPKGAASAPTHSISEEKTPKQEVKVPAEKDEKKLWDIPDFPQALNNAKIVIIFDDAGQNLSQLEKCVSLPFPVTVAVLPRLAYSKKSADLVRSSGNEVMLHQPMQSVNLNVNPGPGALTPDMDEYQIFSTVFQNINEIGPVSGMNNHEGSLITADAEKIASVMKLCSEQGIFFLDSRTNKDTKVPYVANTLGYGYYERNGQFLDNTKKREDILSIIEKNVQTANRQGCVIMIGHVWSADILPGILREVYPVLSAKGYTFTTVSKSGAYKR